MACTTRRVPEWKGDPAPAAKKKIGIGSVYPGCLCSVNASGYLVNGTNTASTRCAGIANGGGTAAVNGAFEVDVHPGGVIKLKNSTVQPVTQAYVGKHCYIEDNETVAISTSQKIRAGLIEAVDSDGVWVNIRAEAMRESDDLEDGGDDEMTLTGMAGLLATAQTPAAHKASHENGGADEISVLGLSGLLGDAQTPTAHAASHAAGAADVISLAALPYSIRQILQSDLAAPFASAGSAAWQTVHTFNIANVASENVLILATLDVRSLAGIAGMASFRITVGGVGGASGQQIDVDMLGVGVQDSKNVTVLLTLGPLAADAARPVTLEILDTAGLTYTVNHAHVLVVRHQG